MKKSARLSLCLLSCLSSSAFAHSFDELTLPPEGLHAQLTISGAYRTDSLVQSSQRWTIPGTLMGGEAYPSEAGLALDEVFLTPIYRVDDTYAVLKFGKHMGSEEPEIDHVFVGHRFNEHFALEGGKMAAIFTPFNGEHTSDSSFSARRLVYDALWGGQYNDQGLRLKTKILGIDSGIELWKGGSFPANEKDTEKSAYDAYARYSREDETYAFSIGAFYYRADANMRDDSRYSATHSHSAVAVATDPSYFNGKVETKGVMGSGSLKLSERWAIGFQGEISAMRQDGFLWDATHQADFKNETTGLWGEFFASFADEKLSFRSERLKVRNDVYGAAALVLSQKLSLLGTSEDPYSHTVSYEHVFSKSFRGRAEFSRDFATLDKKDFFTFSAVWSDMLK